MIINYCVQCGGSLCWNSDFDFEDYGILQDGVIGVFHCGKCNHTYEFFDGEDHIEFVRIHNDNDLLN